MGRGRGYGKILLVGGYTVLKKPNKALVLSVRNAWVEARTLLNNKWRIYSDYGVWEGHHVQLIPDRLRFVRHAILYSQKSEPHSITITSTYHFKPGEKMGLGSSAAVTVAVLKALSPQLTSHELFIRAYRAHSDAQGKLGSGFDIASSIFGSIIYERPNPDGSDYKIYKVQIPENLYIRFYNILDGSTSTTVSARRVLNAVAKSERARLIFDRLADLNNEAINAFSKNDLQHFFELLREINEERRMLGEVSGVNIEPKELDDVRRKIESKGYVTVLPGAGGRDSMVILGDRPIPRFQIPGMKEVKIWLGQQRIRT